MSFDELNIEYKGNNVSCKKMVINYDLTVYLSECTVNNKEVKDSKTDDGYYHYGKYKTEEDVSNLYKEYKIGDEVTYNGIKFYVIEDSDSTKDRVTMMKAEPLTVDEVNTYGKDHVNKYTSSSVGTAYNQNGYGAMAYYSSETCGYTNGSRVETGCTTDYAQSEVKYVIDSWAKDKFKSSDLIVDTTGYSARLITFDELTDNLGYQRTNSGTLYPSSGGDTPDWVYNVKYNYSTMTSYNDSTTAVGRFNTAGYFDGRSVYDIGVGVVRPVVTILKSSLS